MRTFLNLFLLFFFSANPQISWSGVQEEIETAALTNEDVAENLFSLTEEDNSLANLEELTTIRKMYNGLPVFSDRDINRPKSSNNIGIDTNNPGNLVNGNGKGAIGVYLSSNGRYYTVFETINDGYEAMIEEIVAIKQNLQNQNRDMRLSTFLGGRIFGQNWKIDKSSYYYHYAMKRAGGDKRISEISNELLGEIIIVGEGARDMYQAGGKDFSHLATVFIDLRK